MKSRHSRVKSRPDFLQAGKSRFTEEQELELDGIEPIRPVVPSGTGGEIVRNLLLQKLLVEIAVDLIEEVVCAAVEDYVERARREEMRHIDDRVLFPVFGMFLYGTESL